MVFREGAFGNRTGSSKGHHRRGTSPGQSKGIVFGEVPVDKTLFGVVWEFGSGALFPQGVNTFRAEEGSLIREALLTEDSYRGG